ncbi:hypothetical protein GQ53DRAFT_875538 [Thozetella sp. PMI_491]|nr:hypothetical protein GQ53DRAFT_875538 [Thozetella sp. PMI_491]
MAASHDIAVEALEAHLTAQYSISVNRITALDKNVFRIETGDTGNWMVARIFLGADAYHNILNLAGLLKHIGSHTYSSVAVEECADSSSVSTIENPASCVLLTKFVVGKPPQRSKETFFRLGKFMGELHALPVPDHLADLKGGAWHHVAIPGGVDEECAVEKGEKTSECLSRLCETISQIKNAHLDSLPTGFVHPDLVPSNIVARPGTGKHEEWTVVDWVGAGVGPRMVSLGFLLAVAASRGTTGLASAVMKGYLSTGSRIEAHELDERLPICIYERMMMIQSWEVAVGRKEAKSVVEELPRLLDMADEVAQKTREIVQASY